MTSSPFDPGDKSARQQGRTQPWPRFDQAVDAFAETWQAGLGPRIEDYLPPDGVKRLALILELAGLDMERRLALGQMTRIEEYLDRFPELGTDSGIILELAAQEYRLRMNREADLHPDEYAERFPSLADALRQRLAAIPLAQQETVWMGTVAWPAQAPAVTAPTTEDSSGAARTPDRTTRPIPAVPGYEIIEELGHGGMGVVYKAKQVSLGRRLVALKMIRNAELANEADLARFKSEAEAVGRLQHPGIVQIFETGVHNGLPYFSMEHVEGGSLAEKLHGIPLPPDAAARLVILLAQAVQAAHEKGILHRDLKPGNVFLLPVTEGGVPITDQQGKVTNYVPKIGDFGVAKRVWAEAEAPPRPAQTATGAIVGTPSNMAPEQAEGKVRDITPRTDVYALGTILYELLTGRPPFRAATNLETLLQVIAEEPVPPGRLNSNTPRDLETICSKCLQKEQGKRYTDAKALSADLRRFLDGDPVLARPVGRLERSWRWCRRKPALAALLTALGLLLAGSLSFGWWQAEQGRAARERQARNAGAVLGLLDQCERALLSGNASAAVVTLEAAQKRSADGGAESQAERLARLEHDLDLLLDLSAVDQFRWTPIKGKRPITGAVAARYREALAKFGADPNSVGAQKAAERVLGSAVRDQLVAALDQLLREQKSAAVRAALQAADPDPFRDAIRDAVLADNHAALTELANQAQALKQPPEFASFLGDKGLLDAPQRRRELLRAALVHRPGDLGLLMGLGGSYPMNQRDGAEERVRWYQAAVAVAPDNLAALVSLGIALNEMGDQDGAVATYRQIIRLSPRDIDAHHSLGKALRDKGDLDGAIAEFQTTIRLDPEEAGHHNGLGAVLWAKADLAGASAAFNKAIRLNPKDPYTHTSLGAVLQIKGDLEGAMAQYQEALRLEPKFAFARHNLGDVLHLKGDLRGAIAAYQEVLRLDSKATYGHISLAAALTEQGDLDGAIAQYQEVLRLDPKDSTALNNLVSVQRMRELLPRLPHVLAGKDKPKGPSETFGFALLCSQPFQKRTADAVRLFEEAFAADAKLADDLKAGNRYDAACFAIREGCGMRKDEIGQGDKDRARLRERALSWLRADLALLRRRAGSTEAALRQEAAATLANWLIDGNLTRVRPGPNRAPMPAAEGAAWDALWSEVSATLAEARKLSSTVSGR